MVCSCGAAAGAKRQECHEGGRDAHARKLYVGATGRLTCAAETIAAFTSGTFRPCLAEHLGTSYLSLRRVL